MLSSCCCLFCTLNQIHSKRNVSTKKALCIIPGNGDSAKGVIYAVPPFFIYITDGCIPHFPLTSGHVKAYCPVRVYLSAYRLSQNSFCPPAPKLPSIHASLGFLPACEKPSLKELCMYSSSSSPLSTLIIAKADGFVKR